METIYHVQNEVVRPTPIESSTHSNLESNLASTSAFVTPCSSGVPCCHPPPYNISGNVQPPYIIGPNLSNQDYYYVARVDTPDSVKLSNACGFYGGILCILFTIGSFITFFYFVYFVD